jgi:hypothetical protein
MAKGDHQRSENRQDEQMKQSQGYLTGVQQNLANQSSGLTNQYFGGTQPQVGGTFGYGSTVPHFSWTGQPYYSGNGTDTPTPIGGGGGGQINEQSFRAMFPNGISSDQLWAMKDQLAQQGAQVMTNAAGQHGKIKLANGEIVDVIGGMGSGKNQLQWSSDNGIRGGGGGGLFGQAQGDYSNLLGMGSGLFGDFKNLAGQIRGDYGPMLGAAQNMATTGGISEEDAANLRARAISPIRAVYENSLRNVDRQRSLQGGYSPGYTTAMGRFNREMGQGTSDATTNAEAAIAEMRQRGKLGGLSAWGSGLGGQTSGMLGAYGGAGNTLGTMGSLYGTQPGMANLFGSQMLQSQGQNLTAAGLQNNLSLGLMGNQNQVGQIPGNYQNALSNIGGTLGIGARVGGMISPFLGMGGMGSTPVGAAINPNSMFAGYGG